jgi:hypothetical protein
MDLYRDRIRVKKSLEITLERERSRTQPPASDRGPAEEPARDSQVPGGAGAPDGATGPGGVGAPGAADAESAVVPGGDASPGSAARLPGQDPAAESGPDGGAATPDGAGAAAAGPGAAGGGRDPRLAGFGTGGAGDSCPPSAELAAVVAELSGPEWRLDAGEWRPGARIPSVGDLATQHSTSRATVSKAVQRLADDGLLVILPNYGTFVSDSADLAPIVRPPSGRLTWHCRGIPCSTEGEKCHTAEYRKSTRISTANLGCR